MEAVIGVLALLTALAALWLANVAVRAIDAARETITRACLIRVDAALETLVEEVRALEVKQAALEQQASTLATAADTRDRHLDTLTQDVAGLRVDLSALDRAIPAKLKTAALRQNGAQSTVTPRRDVS